MPEWKKNWIEKKRLEEKAKRKERDVYDYDQFNKTDEYKKQKQDKNGFQKPNKAKKPDPEPVS